MTLPQLRVRTEFSYGRVFGPIPRVVAALKGIGCPAAAIVDADTTGHTRWAREAGKSGVRPLFGTELTLTLPDGRKPASWALAVDTRAFYRFSTAARRPDADLGRLFRETTSGIIRFAGAAFTDPEQFDFVDLNPGSPLAQRAAVRLAERTGKPLVLTSDNSYPSARDRDAFLALVDRQQVTPQHILSLDEMWTEFRRWLDARAFDEAVANTVAVAARCASELPRAEVIQVDGDLQFLARSGALDRVLKGHIPKWSEEYQTRLERELDVIAAKKYESYFIVVADLVRWAKTKMLVGPARGSSAGSLVCYCLGITEVDPLVHNLLFERFIDVNRSDLPDIDIDFNDQKRDAVFAYLAEKYGADRIARIGNISTLKPRSVMARVCKKLGIPDKEKFDVLNVLLEYSSGDSRYGKGLEDTFAQTAPGRRFAEKYPEAAIMAELENHASHAGVHAAGVIVCNEPISNFCTVNPDGVIQGDKVAAEALNLLKIDALGLRTLGVIEDAGVVTADELYALKLDDPEVFRIFNEHRFAGVFQFEGETQQMIAKEIEVKSFQQIDHCTALARPGPLGGGASDHYIRRAAGREPVTYRHPTMASYLAQTMGVVLYQEQVMRICFEIGRFDWATVSEIRKAMSGSKGKEYFNRRGGEFVEGALSQGISEETATTLWNEICTFGAWGMNASHTVSYGIISYWCAWMKRYHPLEYAAACLRNAKDDAQTLQILRDIVAEGLEYVPFDFDRSRENWSAQDGKLIGGFMNLEGVGPAKASAAVETRDNGTMTKAQKDKLLAAPVKFRELYPLRTAYASLYEDPEAHGCAAGSRVITAAEFPSRGEVLWLAKVVRKQLRDENEALRIARREGKVIEGQSLFADIHAQDDTGATVTLRIDRFSYEPLGRIALDNLRANEDVVLVRGKRIPGFSMIKVQRMKCLTRPEALR
jgi:DNA-directed DNA polymerase III PolC